MRGRVMGWVPVLSGAALIVIAVAQPMVDPIELIAGVVTMVVGVPFGILYGTDLLADHPDEMELRRRRGAADWQKPVAPPGPGNRPGGLPRRPYDAERDG